MYHLSARSERRLHGVQVPTELVVKGAIRITKRDFFVLRDGGLRTFETQRRFYDEGLSDTLESKHLVGRAVDIGALHKGKVSWSPPHYNDLHEAMNISSLVLFGLPIVWGGRWNMRKGGADYVHFELHPDIPGDIWNGPVPAFLLNGT